MIKNRHFLPAYIFALLMFIYSSLPGSAVEKAQASKKFFLNIIFSGTFLHIFAFGVLTGLLCYGFYRGRISPFPFLKIGLLAFGYGLFIEVYQVALPYRLFKINDIILNAGGVVISLVLFKLFIAINDRFIVSRHVAGD